MLTKTDGSGTTTYTYTVQNWLSTVTDFLNQQTVYTYDVDGHVTKIAYPGGTYESYTYANGTELTNITTVPAGATISHYLGFAYSYVKPGTSTHTSLRFTMTPRNGATVTYAYDALNRLTGATGTGSSYSYSYDPAGNITSETLNGTTTSLTYNAANELTNTGSAFDANGNQTASSLNGFVYNAANQTQSITPAGGTAVPMSYIGPGQTERTQRASTSYQYTRGAIDKQTDGGNTTTFVTTPSGTPLEMMLSNPSGCPTGESCPSTGYSTYVYGHDALGSVTSVISMAGTVQDQYTYDPYGNMTSGSTGSDPNPFHYIGGVLDPQTQLYKLGARYYDPQKGRFTQQDPAACSSTTNAYWYGNDDPVNVSDPSGEYNICDLVYSIVVSGVSAAICFGACVVLGLAGGAPGAVCAVACAIVFAWYYFWMPNPCAPQIAAAKSWRYAQSHGPWSPGDVHEL